jgi:hypothetical protein
MKKNKPYMSKSEFMTFTRCPRLFWLSRYKPELATPIDDVTQNIFDLGHQVGLLAQNLFPNGKTIINGKNNVYKMASDTTEAMADNSIESIFEATFINQGLLCKVDILNRMGNKSWSLNEVKMGTEPKPDNILDVAFQTYLLKSDGIGINKCNLIYINKSYLRNGSIDSSEFFMTADVTEDVDGLQTHIEETVVAMKSVDKADDEPQIILNGKCKSPGKCPFISYCKSPVPPYSVHELPYGHHLTPRLLAQGIVLLKDIPIESTKLSPRQLSLIKSAKQEKPIFNKSGISQWISKLKFPLHFFDFETLAGFPFPPFNNTIPYEPVPFQFSMDVVKSEGANPIHHDFLVENNDDSRKALIKAMFKYFEKHGSIIAWNMSFELRVIKTLSERFPEHADQLSNISTRFVDLIDIFRDGNYAHYKIGGSASLKSVVPVLLPQQAYDGLEIRSGDKASLLYQRYITGQMTEQQWQEKRTSLLLYCGRDTGVMIKILDILKAL